MTSPRPRSLERLATELGFSEQERGQLFSNARNQLGIRAGEPIRLNILDPFIAHRNGQPLGLGSPIQRTLLGLFACTSRSSSG